MSEKQGIETDHYYIEAREYCGSPLVPALIVPLKSGDVTKIFSENAANLPSGFVVDYDDFVVKHYRSKQDEDGVTWKTDPEVLAYVQFARDILTKEDVIATTEPDDRLRIIKYFNTVINHYENGFEHDVVTKHPAGGIRGINPNSTVVSEIGEKVLRFPYYKR